MAAELDAVVETRPGEETSFPDANGHFGRYGGRFVAETLMQPLAELEGDMGLPGGRRLSDCLRACSDQRLNKIGSLRFASEGRIS